MCFYRLRPACDCALQAFDAGTDRIRYTHDSIGLAKTAEHQPVEHLAISPPTPNTHVFRPADTVETAKAWESR